MKIIDDGKVIDFMQDVNNNRRPDFSIQKLQIHIDYNCGCKITQDKKGNSLFPCESHYSWANKKRDGKTLHKVLH